MVLLYILLFLFAYHHPNSATAFGRVLAKKDATTVPPFPEPIIFHNLTTEEFTAKILQHYGTSLKRTTDNPDEGHAYHGTLGGHRVTKRVAMGGETQNDADQQAIVEIRTLECQAINGINYRAVKGHCVDATVFEFTCGRIGSPHTYPRVIRSVCKGKPHVPDEPDEPAVCLTREVHNVYGAKEPLPFCSEFINVMTKEKEGGSVPTFEGFRNIPKDGWAPFYVDTFWGLGDNKPGTSTAKYDYRGLHPSGKTFRSQSPTKAHSWCCLGCPSGRLHVETVGFQAQAFGLTLPAGSWT